LANGNAKPPESKILNKSGKRFRPKS